MILITQKLFNNTEGLRLGIDVDVFENIVSKSLAQTLWFSSGIVSKSHF